MKCSSCGDDDVEPVEILLDGTVVAAGSLCDACFAHADAAKTELDRQYHELLDAGVPREAANTIMISRIDGKIDQA